MNAIRIHVALLISLLPFAKPVGAQTTSCSLFDTRVGIDTGPVVCPVSDSAMVTSSFESPTSYSHTFSGTASAGGTSYLGTTSGNKYQGLVESRTGISRFDIADCVVSGPASNVEAQLVIEATAHASVTNIGSPSIVINGISRSSWGFSVSGPITTDASFVLQAFANSDGSNRTFSLCNYGLLSPVPSCSNPYSDSTFAVPKTLFVTPTFSVAVGQPFGITLQDSGNTWIVGVLPTSTVNSATGQGTATFPTDGSSVLLLPEGFTLNCPSAGVVNNVWEAGLLPTPVPSLGLPSLFVLAALLAAASAFPSKRH